MCGPRYGKIRAPLHSLKTGSIDMLDHVTLGVSDIERSQAFYDSALRSLGIERLYADGDGAAGYGTNGKAFFWIGRKSVSQTGAHVAFTAADRETVERFYRQLSASPCPAWSLGHTGRPITI
jgi:hypothetical protein